jgi:hypothetical protein
VACGRRFRPWKVWFASYVVLVGLLGAGLWYAGTRLWEAAEEQGRLEQVKDETPRPVRTTTTTLAPLTTVAASTTVTPGVDAPVVQGITIEATSTGLPAQNSCGEETRYDAELALDGRPDTAWRVSGEGTGEELTLTLPAPTRLLSVGLVPGYDKVDGCSGDDRFPQHRRITQVLWLFDGGAQVNQTFVDDRTLQSVPVDVVATTVTVRILGTTQAGVLDYTPVSEIQLKGVPPA